MMDEYLKRLQELAECGDSEAAHVYADKVLCDALTDLGQQELVDAWEKVRKWYS